MAKIIGNVYEESDYSVFKRLPDNRDVLSDRVNKLIASMTERYICNPIIVNEHMEVIDGQGRFEARKEMNVPIHYIIVPGANSDDCRRMNKYNTKWTGLDFAKSYAKKGVSAYVLILKTCELTHLSISSVLRLSNHSGSATGANFSRDLAMSKFEKGLMDYTEKDVETVQRIAKMSNEILEALAFTGRVNESFRTAVKIITETDDYDHNRMLRNCKASRSSYAQMSKLKDQLVEFERIYNRRAGNHKLFFSDYMRNRGHAIRDYSKLYSPYDDTDISTLKEA